MLETLILCMALDYLTGMMAAGIFHKSKKSAEGGLESRSGWKGLCRKGISLLIVLVSYRMDLIAGTNFICNAVMAAYLVKELLSITENLRLMGVPVPKVLSGEEQKVYQMPRKQKAKREQLIKRENEKLEKREEKE